MGELGLNKIFGSILAAALIIMGLQTVSAAVFSSGGHHGHHGEKKPYNEAIKDKYAYWTEVSVGGEGEAVEEEVYDLGLLLAGADASRGERVFGSVCASCHTINEGGANGTGPNLYGLVGRDIASTSGFGYSSAINAVDGGWTYEALDAWIIDPQAFARGSAMVANVKRETDRANLIAYLAANTPGAPAFPAPLPEEGAPVAEEASVEDAPAEDGGSALGELEEIVEDMEEIVDGAEDTLTETIETTTDDIIETVEEGIEELEIPAEPELPAEEPAEDVER